MRSCRSSSSPVTATSRWRWKRCSRGACDFLQKPFRDQDLIDRIQRALAKDASNRVELAERTRIVKRFESLTPREKEILALMCSGKANKVMAADLGLSQRTVEIHRSRVMEKMAASSLAQLVRMMMDGEADFSRS